MRDDIPNRDAVPNWPRTRMLLHFGNLDGTAALRAVCPADVQRISDTFLRPLIRSASWNSSSAIATTSMMHTENAAA